MENKHSLKNNPKWKERYKELFLDIAKLQVYDDKISDGTMKHPLGPLLEEFMDTVYNEGFRDGKESKKED